MDKNDELKEPKNGARRSDSAELFDVLRELARREHAKGETGHQSDSLPPSSVDESWE